ncbi:MAG: hypothetical protein JW937_01555 [Candidatus Omnitrophica bacterium]|nr:hypothetical protein [Candidatus Omnitrophota bacterium]
MNIVVLLTGMVAAMQGVSPGMTGASGDPGVLRAASAWAEEATHPVLEPALAVLDQQLRAAALLNRAA